MKIEAFLNYRVSRLIIGTAIGIPATAISVILGFSWFNSWVRWN